MPPTWNAGMVTNSTPVRKKPNAATAQKMDSPSSFLLVGTLPRGCTRGCFLFLVAWPLWLLPARLLSPTTGRWTDSGVRGRTLTGRHTAEVVTALTEGDDGCHAQLGCRARKGHSWPAVWPQCQQARPAACAEGAGCHVCSVVWIGKDCVRVCVRGTGFPSLFRFSLLFFFCSANVPSRHRSFDSRQLRREPVVTQRPTLSKQPTS